ASLRAGCVERGSTQAEHLAAGNRCPRRLCDVLHQVDGVLDAHTEAHQAIAYPLGAPYLDGQQLMSAGRRHAGERGHVAQGDGVVDELQRVEERRCSRSPTLELDGDHATEVAHLAGRDRVPRMVFEAWIVDSDYVGLRAQRLG